MVNYSYKDRIKFVRGGNYNGRKVDGAHSRQGRGFQGAAGGGNKLRGGHGGGGLHRQRA